MAMTNDNVAKALQGALGHMLYRTTEVVVFDETTGKLLPVVSIETSTVSLTRVALIVRTPEGAATTQGVERFGDKQDTDQEDTDVDPTA
jgi:hypothetical protein